MTAPTLSKTALWTDKFGMDTAPIPVTGYTSPEYYEQEIDRLWKKTWIEIGRLHKISEPGSYFVKDLTGLDVSILVTRAKDGRLHAFHNSCAHRCSRLVFNEGGRSKMITCPFHGWAYHLDGRLALITDEDNFFDIDKAAFGLTPVHVDTWADFVFICLDPEPQETLAEFLGDIYDGLAGYPFAEFTQDYAYTAELQCNWKVVRDAFLESYHLRFLHKDTIGSSAFSADNPYAHSLNFATTKYHVQKSQYATPDYVPSPMEMLAFSTGARSVAVPHENLDTLPEMLNPTRSKEWSSDITSVLPSLMVACFPDFFLHFNWRPVAAGKSILEIRQCMRPPQSATERWAHEVLVGSLYQTALEDIVTVEGIQQNMQAGARKHFVLQDQEFAIRHAHHFGQQFAGTYPEA